MNEPRDLERQVVGLDACIDRLIAGERWAGDLPTQQPDRDQVAGLMQIAERILGLARETAPPEVGQRQRIRKRFEGPRGILRQIAFYRLPYLPPLWIKPEAC